MKVRFKSKVTRGFSFSPLRGSLTQGKFKKNLWDQGKSLNKFLDCCANLSRPVRFDLCPTNPTVTDEQCEFLHRMDVNMIFFSFNYGSSLSTSESRAKTPLPDSFECFFDLQRSFGNTLRALFLKNRDFFWYCEIFLPNTRGPLGCLLGFWPSGPKPCGGN